MSLPIPAVASRCDACLGSRHCWVCLGQGRVERTDGGYAVCRRCDGTGRCSYCNGEDSSSTAQSGPVVIPLEQPQPAPFA